jgi:hypothetical protein
VTVAISISIGQLARDAARTVRFSSAVPCLLEEFCVERAPARTSEEAAYAIVLADTDLEIESRGETVELVAARDALLERLPEREWERTRDVVLELLRVEGSEDADDQRPVIEEITDAGALAAFLRGRSRVVLPLDSGQRIPPGATAQITARPQHVAFRPKRFAIGGGHPERWEIDDLLIGNRSQFSRQATLSGELFDTNAIDALVSFETVQLGMDIRLLVRYVGPVEEGEVFRAMMSGTPVDEGRQTILPAGALATLRIKNLGPEGDLRAVWLGTEAA